MRAGTEPRRQTIRDAFGAWRAGTAPSTDMLAPEMVGRIEDASRERRTATWDRRS
jgi:hypothetical protein